MALFVDEAAFVTGGCQYIRSPPWLLLTVALLDASCTPPTVQGSPVGLFCIFTAEAAPVVAPDSLTGQVLMPFYPYGFGGSDSANAITFNFSLDGTAKDWNQANGIPVAGLQSPKPLSIPSCGPTDPGCPVGGPFTSHGNFSSYANPIEMATTVVELVNQPPATGLPGGYGAATAKFTAEGLASDAGYPEYPTWITPLTPLALNRGQDGPKAAFDADVAAALISSSMNFGTAPRQTQLEIFGDYFLTGGCVGNPGSGLCARAGCINVSPQGLTPAALPTGGIPASQLQVACGPDSAVGSRFNDNGVATHAPVVSFDGYAFVFFLLTDPAQPNSPVPTIAAVDYDTQSPTVHWFSLPSLPAPIAAGLQNSVIGVDNGPVVRNQIPMLALGTVPPDEFGAGDRLLYLAWHQTRNSGSSPI